MEDPAARAAVEALSRSYSPYSRFRVGSSVLCSDGRIFSGANVENASYGLSMCAERVAIFKAVSEGCREISRVCVATEAGDPVPPCGACLQVMVEFSRDDSLEIVMVSKSGKLLRKRLGEILALRFSPRDLLERPRA